MRPMEMDPADALSAFVDGEPVDTAALATALGQPGARETLIDFVRLRAAVALDDEPSPAFVAAMRRRLGGARGRRRLGGLLRLAAAVAIAALATVGAYDLVRGGRQPRLEEPPAPTRVIRFEPGIDWKPVQGR